MMRMVKHCHRLPRQDASSLETFEVRVDRALSNLIYLKMPLLIAGELDQMTRGPFQPQEFCFEIPPALVSFTGNCCWVYILRKYVSASISLMWIFCGVLVVCVLYLFWNWNALLCATYFFVAL